MKAVTCQSVCLEIEEAELDSQPGELAREHLRGCPTCLRFFEERSKLRQLVGSLGTVSVPSDFDFRLRARLAQERSQRSQFAFGGFSFGLPSAAIAALVLVLGTVFVFRALRTEPIGPVGAVESGQQSPPSIKPPTPDRQAVATITPAKDHNAQQTVTAKTPKAAGGPKHLTATNNKDRTATKDFSILPAPVVKRDEQVANAAVVFPIDVSSESMKLSLDDASGVSRTITVPRLSFGSERLNDRISTIKTSAKGVW